MKKRMNASLAFAPCGQSEGWRCSYCTAIRAALTFQV